jgi:hypothetical protein
VGGSGDNGDSKLVTVGVGIVVFSSFFSSFFSFKISTSRYQRGVGIAF